MTVYNYFYDEPQWRTINPHYLSPDGILTETDDTTIVYGETIYPDPAPPFYNWGEGEWAFWMQCYLEQAWCATFAKDSNLSVPPGQLFTDFLEVDITQGLA